MPDIDLQRLRKLRSRAEDLFGTLVDDLTPFQSKEMSFGFRRTPDKPQTTGDVNVTTTCSCLMGLAQSGKLKEFYKQEPVPLLQQILENTMKAVWQSSGLSENNAFTTSLVIRLCGSLVASNYLPADEIKKLTKSWELNKTCSSEPKTLELIAQELSTENANFGINTYPPAAAVVYWFLDGADHAGFDLDKRWSALCTFAADEFRRQRSLVVAKHTAMMDPVAMAMAACLCARLHNVIKRSSSAPGEYQSEALPSMIELESAVVDLFVEQTPTGLWSKYFPLFHYNEAGSNFCYTFELLEAVLLEFGGKDSHILLEETVISGLERAVSSCESNRLECKGPKDGDIACSWISYVGWNSGGNFQTLRRGQPESWATAVVHMFLGELIDVLSRHIQQRLLKQYEAKIYTEEKNGLSMLVDIKVHLDGETSLRSILQSEFVSTFTRFSGDESELLLKAPAKKNKALSALLFGPPGTSKTEIAKALAATLKWPLVEIDPSLFLQNTFQNIYVQAETIFKDVMDMYGVVVLFDELDALVQKRDGTGTPDTESKFLTTYMLPKLAKLHDQRRLIFLMATNFQENFDDAIKRAGRFDFLLCMGPPSLEEKCSSLHVFLGREHVTRENEARIKACGASLLQQAQSDPRTADQLELYTYLEFRSFILKLGDDVTKLEAKLADLGPQGLRQFVLLDSQSVGLRLKDLDILNQNRKSSSWKPGHWNRLQDLYTAEFDEEHLKDRNGRLTPAVEYVVERKQSKRQI